MQNAMGLFLNALALVSWGQEAQLQSCACHKDSSMEAVCMHRLLIIV